MADCCQTTEDGKALCVLPADGQTSACASKTDIPSSEGETSGLPIHPASLTSLPAPSAPGLWQQVRSGVMFGVACLTSPCCTPLLVPLGIALLAGTPVAAWLTAHAGWVYGGLTLLSVVSLGLGFSWTKHQTKPTSKSASRRPFSKETSYANTSNLSR